MSGRDGQEELRVEIGSIVVPASYDARDLAARIEREIADRRFGPGTDPLVAAIAAQLSPAIDAIRDSR
jgi:hypothetical protein